MEEIRKNIASIIVNSNISPTQSLKCKQNRSKASIELVEVDNFKQLKRLNKLPELSTHEYLLTL